MRDIYIVLIRANTGLGKIARKITGYEYTHIAVSLDRSLTDFISFSRRYHSFPFDAGFMHEYRDYYAYGIYDYFKAKVYRLPLSDLDFQTVLDYIISLENNKKQIFNLFSMITMPFLHGFRIHNANNCMSFTAKIIELSRRAKMLKPYYKYSIKDIDELISNYLFFEGMIKRRDSAGYREYMRHFQIFKYITDLTKLISLLTFRFILYKT